MLECCKEVEIMNLIDREAWNLCFLGIFLGDYSPHTDWCGVDLTLCTMALLSLPFKTFPVLVSIVVLW